MDDFFTLASFATLSTCVLGVVAVVNTVRHAFHWGPRWFGLLVAIAFALIALNVTVAMGNPPEKKIGLLSYIIALVNGCIIYTSAFGVQNNIIVELVGDRGTTRSGVHSAPSAVTPW